MNHMITAEQKEALMALLSSHPVAVVATASAMAVPGAAVILYAEQPDLSLIFGTHKTFKYKNLKANSAAAFAISKGMQAIQMHGQAVEELNQVAAKNLFSIKHPEMDQHLLAGSVFFRFTPGWVRYLDYGNRPPIQWEAELG